MNTKIQEKLKLLPDKPGVYKMFNAQGELIYVGKAVNLKCTLGKSPRTWARAPGANLAAQPLAAVIDVSLI